jgi:hypothetical protein
LRRAAAADASLHRSTRNTHNCLITMAADKQLPEAVAAFKSLQQGAEEDWFSSKCAADRDDCCADALPP